MALGVEDLYRELMARVSGQPGGDQPAANDFAPPVDPEAMRKLLDDLGKKSEEPKPGGGEEGSGESDGARASAAAPSQRPTAVASLEGVAGNAAGPSESLSGSATTGGSFDGGGFSGGAAIGGWWTPERMKYAADYLIKNAGLSPQGAAGLVARWAGVESNGGPGSLNPTSGAEGIAQWLGARKIEGVTNGSFDAQLANVVKELNSSEKAAGDALRAAGTLAEGARGASMYERAEGYNPSTGTDNFTSRTPVQDVYGQLYEGSAAEGDRVVIGDSLGVGAMKALGLSGNALTGLTPRQVLDVINGKSVTNQFGAVQGAGDLTGKTVILSSGASNDPASAGLLAAQIAAAKARGAANVTVMGTGNADVNRTLQSIAAQSGSRFAAIPPNAIGPDGVHPTNYGFLRSQTAFSGAPSPQPTSSANAPPVRMSAYGGPVARAATGEPVMTDAQGRSIDPTTGKPAQAPVVGNVNPATAASGAAEPPPPKPAAQPSSAPQASAPQPSGAVQAPSPSIGYVQVGNWPTVAPTDNSSDGSSSG
jgi:hypothetical protein